MKYKIWVKTLIKSYYIAVCREKNITFANFYSWLTFSISVFHFIDVIVILLAVVSPPHATVAPFRRVASGRETTARRVCDSLTGC